MPRKVLTPTDIYQSRARWPQHLKNEILYRPSRKGETLKALEVTSYRALVRVIGYCWYRSQHHVLLRGQTTCYGNLRSGAYRSATGRALRDNIRDLDTLLEEFRAQTGFDSTPEQKLSTEPLLQHYGIRTRWLDFVDSIPHALFFATHEYKDSPFKSGCKTYLPAPSGEGLIYIVDIGNPRPYVSGRQQAPGIYRTDWGGIVCDLRRAKPAIALRPHAQHGWLVRAPPSQPDLWSRMLLRVYFDARAARSWLHGAGSLDREALFPPKSWDEMYRSLFDRRAANVFASHGAGQITEYDFH